MWVDIDQFLSEQGGLLRGYTGDNLILPKVNPAHELSPLISKSNYPDLMT